MQCFRHRFGLVFQNITKIVLEKVVKELKLVQVLVYLGVGGHGDRLMKLFGSCKTCYDGQ